MDDQGLWERKDKAIPIKELHARLTLRERAEWFIGSWIRRSPEIQKRPQDRRKEASPKPRLRPASYDEKLSFCSRPEQIDGPPRTMWNDINEHLDRTRGSIAELVRPRPKAFRARPPCRRQFLRWRKYPLRSGTHRLRRLRI